MKEQLRSMLIGLVKGQIMAALVRALPFLGGGFFGSIAGFFVGKLATFLVNKTILGAQILSDRYTVNNQVKEIEKLVIMAKQEGLSDEQKQQITERFNRASDALIRL